MIAILGTGLLGSGFARAALRRGESVQVWNRSPAKAQALQQDGAIAKDDAAAAIRGATRVHLVLSDDAAVDSVLAAAAPAAGTVVVDHSTTSTAGALRRTEEWPRSGVTYVHAPVFMGPSNALEASGVMLISGARKTVAELTPVLSPMTGKVVDLGERIDAAAATKLLGNLLLMVITAGMADVLGLAKAMDVAPSQVLGLLHAFNPGASLPARLQRMIEQPYDDPSWELSMARKDARLMQREAADADVALALLPAIAARMDAVIEQGFGAKDWTVLARDFLR